MRQELSTFEASMDGKEGFHAFCLKLKGQIARVNIRYAKDICSLVLQYDCYFGSNNALPHEMDTKHNIGSRLSFNDFNLFLFRVETREGPHIL